MKIYFTLLLCALFEKALAQRARGNLTLLSDICMIPLERCSDDRMNFKEYGDCMDCMEDILGSGYGSDCPKWLDRGCPRWLECDECKGCLDDAVEAMECTLQVDYSCEINCDEPSSDDVVNDGGIAGIAIGAAAVLTTVIGLTVALVLSRRRGDIEESVGSPPSREVHVREHKLHLAHDKHHHHDDTETESVGAQSHAKIVTHTRVHPDGHQSFIVTEEEEGANV